MLLLLIFIGGGKISGQTTETVTFDKAFYGNSNTNDLAKETNYCKLTFAANDATNDPLFSSSSEEIRLYKAPSTGKTGGGMTITAKEGLKITKIDYNFSGNTNHNFIDDNGTSDINQNTEWAGESSFVTINNMHNSSQLKIKSVTITYSGDTKAATTTTFGTDIDNKTFTVIEGDETSFTSKTAILTPTEAGTITYSSSKEDVVTVDAKTGKVTFGNTFGTTIITAKYAGNETYFPSEAEYTIIYKEQTGNSFTFSKNANSFAKVGTYVTTNTTLNNVILVDNNGVEHSGYQTTGGYTAQKNGCLQLQKNTGKLISPEFTEFANGYKINVIYYTSGNSPITITAGDVKATGVKGSGGEQAEGTGSSATLNVPNGVPFTIIAGNACYIGEIEIIPNKAPETITLDETKENTITAAENVTVSLVRTLDNSDWNTFCVPFDISEEQVKAVFGEGTKITEFTSADNTNKMMMFTEATSIEAGKPYLVMPGNESVANPMFEGVTVTEGEPQAVTYGDYAFVGVYSPYAMKTDKTELFVGANGTLSTPAEGKNSMKGMRAFIRLSSADTRLQSISIGGNGTTGISITESEKMTDGNVYDLNGRLVGKDTKSLKKGIYIMNGKKIIK